MAFTYRLEHADGTLADPPTYRSTVLNWRQGDKIPLTRSGLFVKLSKRGAVSASGVEARA